MCRAATLLPLLACAIALYAWQLPAIPAAAWRSDPDHTGSNAKGAASTVVPSLAIDLDAALGVPRRDIDDAIALHYVGGAQQREEVRLASVTTVFGNAPLRDTHRVASVLAQDRWQLGVTPTAGARRRGDHDTAAARALRHHAGTVVLLGPATNAASALALGARWQHLIALGGTVRSGFNVRPWRTTELNFALDEDSAVQALDLAAERSIPVTLFPMEVCRQVLFRPEDLAGFSPLFRSEAASWLTVAPLVTGRLSSLGAFHPWDLLPVVFVTHPHLFRTERKCVVFPRRWWQRGHIAYAEDATCTRDEGTHTAGAVGVPPASRRCAGERGVCLSVAVDVDVLALRQVFEGHMRQYQPHKHTAVGLVGGKDSRNEL